MTTAKFTKAHYEFLAEFLSRERAGIGRDNRIAAIIDGISDRLTIALYDISARDINGNRRFDNDRFIAACRKPPKGSLFP